jgi:alkanesulfonate monooxygenase SsuD/methylene tetrahydromethanopterin reductase-like flavin-dependent oxidoreductase (luciferase family)
VTTPLGVALSGHHHRLPTVTRLARRADELGYDVVFVDGDTAVVEGRPEASIYEGMTLSGAALAETVRARVGSIRLPFFWNPILLARGLATLQEASGGRVLAFFGIGGRDGTRIGLPDTSPAERVEWLDDVLGALRPLMRGKRITHHGPHVRIDRVRIPDSGPPPPIIVAAAGLRALEIVDRHADVWDANVPPLRERVERRRERLKRQIETWIWVFARPGASLDAAITDYRRHWPWFDDVPEGELPRALLWGEPARCRDQLEAMRVELSVERLILDLIGLDEEGARRALDALAPAKESPIA